MKDRDPEFDETQFKVRIQLANEGVVTTAIAILNRGGSTLTSRGQGRAHPAAEMRHVREDLAVGRALVELGRKLQSAAADEYGSAVKSMREPAVPSRAVA